MASLGAPSGAPLVCLGFTLAVLWMISVPLGSLWCHLSVQNLPGVPAAPLGSVDVPSVSLASPLDVLGILLIV